MSKPNSDWPRRSGVLLHISSLPGPYGVGDLGQEAYRFVDWLAETKQTIWQILPLNPTGYGDSPYQGFSVFAGNPLFISLDELLKVGWLRADDFHVQPIFSETHVEYGEVIGFHTSLLEKAFSRFVEYADKQNREAFHNWCDQEKHWLRDYALFMTLKQINEGRPFFDWDKKERQHDSLTLANIQKKHHAQIDSYKFQQWLFFTQWKLLKKYANSKGVEVFGDLPIYTGFDCSDVWAHQDLFHLDKQSLPTVVAGLPPDFFSATGQLWGNPIYKWSAHKDSGFSWWIERLKTAFEIFDISRVDHFRGFAGYWEVSADRPTAAEGRWAAGPGQPFFDAVFKELPDIKLVAEDLGIITPDVVELVENNNLPGMSVLQFAWDGSDDNSFLPHNDKFNRVVFLGTHDNETINGWWQSAPQRERDCFVQYSSFLEEVESVHWAHVRIAMMSIAHTCIISMQDIFGLGSEARMNFPGRLGHNWDWRLPRHFLDDPIKDKLRQYTLMYGRCPSDE
jgi:4-alpha-glucanotransferase